MIVDFDRSFYKSIEKIKSKAVLQKAETIILEIEKARSINELKNVKKLVGFKSYYRIRLSDFRLGFEKINSQKIRLIIVAHRKDIYRMFP